MKKVILTFALIVIYQVASACSIFACQRNGKMLVGSNEDGDYPFSFMRVVPSTSNSYGAIFLGTSDMQAQSGVNEHGLFFDFTYLPEGEVDKSFLPTIDSASNSECSFTVSDLLFECKTVEEFLKKFEDQPYAILTSQLMVADATGAMAIINTQDIIRRNNTDFMASTNFNICNASDGNYSCGRFDTIHEELNKNKNISVNSFQNLLDKVHVEGNVATQYSNVYDLKEGKIYMNLYHNFQETNTIDIKDELKKGMQIVPLQSMFKEKNYTTLNTIKSHPDYYREILVQEFAKSYENGLKAYVQLLNKNPDKTEKINKSVGEVSFILTARSRVKETNQPLIFYYNPEFYTCKTQWTSSDEELKTALKLKVYLEEKDLVNKDLYFYEDMAYLYMVLGNKEESVSFFNKALDMAEEDENWNIERISYMISILENS